MDQAEEEAFHSLSQHPCSSLEARWAGDSNLGEQPS